MPALGEAHSTRIILIRHGQTVWNKEDRFRGQTDLELDDKGLRQAEAVASRLSEWSVNHLISSPMKRAWRTAQAIASSLGLEIERHDGFNDINYGRWQGRSPAEVAAEQPSLYRQWLEQPQLVNFLEGESLDQVRKRAAAALEELVAQQKWDTTVIVSHKVVCKLLVLHVLGLDTSHFWRVEQDIAAINVFEVRDNVMLASLINDTCHLRDLRTEKTVS